MPKLNNMNEKEPNKSGNTNNPIIWLIIIFILLFQGGKKLFNKKSYTKEQLASLYNVNRKTLTKWVQLFAPDMWKDFKSIRKITTFQYLELIEVLGENTEETPVLTKNEIAQMCDSDVRTLRNCVVNNPNHFGLSLDAYKSVSKFPPLVAKNIIEAFT